MQPIIYKPAILHPPAPASRIGYNNHRVPYPLSLMPYESWNRLHHGSDLDRIPFICCSVCGGKREALAHVRKLFLVAERLTWQDELVSMTEKNRNANLNNKLNHELNIRGPAIDYQEHVSGGKHSKTKKFHPYGNEHEMKLAFKLLFMTDSLTIAAWSLWIGTQLDLERMLEGDGAAGSLLVETTAGRTEAPKTTSSLSGLLTPPSSSKEEIRRRKIPASTTLRFHTTPATQQSQSTAKSTTLPSCSKRIVGYRSLQDFYALLDRIERNSYAGALFLKAYAERLRDDMCKDCWFKHNVRLDIF